MKIAIISDIHANYNYLEKISFLIRKEKVQKILFLGDAVGYYDDPNKVVEWLRDNQVICIKGNHDKYLLKELTYDISRESLYRISDHRKKMTPANIEFMKSWTDNYVFSFEDKKIFASHSGFENSEQYCRSTLDLNKERLLSYDYYLFGHTHIPWIEYYHGTCILNPGSIGQPRDYSTTPSFAILDLTINNVILMKPKIDFFEYLEHLKNLQYDPQIIKILSRTKKI